MRKLIFISLTIVIPGFNNTLLSQLNFFTEGGSKEVSSGSYSMNDLKVRIPVPSGYDGFKDVSFEITVGESKESKTARVYQYVATKEELKGKKHIDLWIKNGEKSDFYFYNTFKEVKEYMNIDLARNYDTRTFQYYNLSFGVYGRTVSGKELQQNWVGNTVAIPTYDFKTLSEYNNSFKYDLGKFEAGKLSADKSFSVPKKYEARDRITVMEETIEGTNYGTVQKLYAFGNRNYDHPKSVAAIALAFDNSKASKDELKSDIVNALSFVAGTGKEPKFKWERNVGKGFKFVYPYYLNKFEKNEKKGGNKSYMDKYPKADWQNVKVGSYDASLLTLAVYEPSYVYNKQYVGEDKVDKNWNLSIYILEKGSRTYVLCTFDHDGDKGPLSESDTNFFNEFVNGFKVL